MKLLIVDDSPEMRMMLRNICTNHFDEIHECEDGFDAIKAYDEQNPDWVLMDIKMKVMDGIKATVKIKLRHPEAKIIMISQFKDRNIIDESLKAGAQEFVCKDDLMRIEEIIKIK
jgi:DNA-binding NarL/FixJ family response regulator